jgi:cytochrome o ubiquinol oxidase subunit 1
VAIIGAYIVFVWFAWRDVEEYVIPAEQVAELDRERRQVRQEWLDQHPQAAELV